MKSQNPDTDGFHVFLACSCILGICH